MSRIVRELKCAQCGCIHNTYMSFHGQEKIVFPWKCKKCMSENETVFQALGELLQREKGVEINV